jgi:hypothetical protein
MSLSGRRPAGQRPERGQAQSPCFSAEISSASLTLSPTSMFPLPSLVELHPVVAARQLARDLQADAGIAPWVDVGPLALDVQDDLVGHAVDRQLDETR